VPVYITDNVARYKKVAEELYIKTGRQPEVDEMAKALVLSEREVLKLQSFVDTVEPIDRMQSTDVETMREIPESMEPTITNQALEQFELDQQMTQLFDELNERESAIIKFRYGMEDGRAHTLEETGKRFSLTRERIRQIEKDVMKRLRVYVKDNAAAFDR
jgi:RNA polymerase sigma factor (sigma-70 family)